MWKPWERYVKGGEETRNLRCLLGDIQGEMLGGQLASHVLSPKARSELEIYIWMVFKAMGLSEVR